MGWAYNFSNLGLGETQFEKGPIRRVAHQINESELPVRARCGSDLLRPDTPAPARAQGVHVMATYVISRQSFGFLYKPSALASLGFLLQPQLSFYSVGSSETESETERGRERGSSEAATMVEKASKGRKEEVVTREYTINLHKRLHGW